MQPTAEAQFPLPLPETVTIPKDLYDRLQERDDWLGWLEAAGVDNWSGYEDAQAMRDEAEA